MAGRLVIITILLAALCAVAAAVLCAVACLLFVVAGYRLTAELSARWIGVVGGLSPIHNHNHNHYNIHIHNWLAPLPPTW